jgi:hypothetical protein
MEFKKSLSISEKAFVEYQTLAPDHTLVRKIAGTLIILVGVGFYVGSETGIVNTIITIATVSALYVFLITYVNKLAAGMFSKRNYRKNNISSIKVDMTLNHNGLKFAVNDKTANYKWEQFKDIVVTETGFYFYVSTSSALIIDKANLSQTDLNNINQIIKNHLVEKTKLKTILKK